jgi:hypothetical protein
MSLFTSTTKVPSRAICEVSEVWMNSHSDILISSATTEDIIKVDTATSNSFNKNFILNLYV